MVVDGIDQERTTATIVIHRIHTHTMKNHRLVYTHTHYEESQVSIHTHTYTL